jgi:hypothetical protein
MKRLLPCLLLALVVHAADAPRLLWRHPRTLTLEDWTCGSGGCGNGPRPPFRFLENDLSGSSPKVSVSDANGRQWSAKFGAEVIPECFGARFVGALGYFTEPTYFVACGTIDDPAGLHRARRVVKKDGAFARARFQLRGEKDFEFLPGRTWSWTNNPFLGTRELAGLKITMMLLSNWDAKDSRDGSQSNNNIFRGPSGLMYSVYDWGASLGRWGGVFRRDQSDCSAYFLDSPQFVRGVENGEVEFGFIGKHGEDLKHGITVEDVRWLLPYLLRITPEQLRAGLKAAGATERQTACWAESIEARIRQLQAAAR